MMQNQRDQEHWGQSESDLYDLSSDENRKKNHADLGGRQTADFYRENDVLIKEQEKIQKLDNYVDVLALQMKNWIESQMSGQPSSRKVN